LRVYLVGSPPCAGRRTSAGHPRGLARGRRRTCVIEVMLGNGRTLKVDEGIDPAALARLVEVLDGDRS
jgi:hypothetical protein